MANHMDRISKLLGVKIGEEFYIRDVFTSIVPQQKFKITGTGVHCMLGTLSYVDTEALSGLLTGKYEIIPLEVDVFPKENELYFYVTQGFQIGVTAWHGDCILDLMNLKVGNVFRTEQEAINFRPSFYESLTGDDWSDYVDKVQSVRV